jgi:hypothetical protein
MSSSDQVCVYCETPIVNGDCVRLGGDALHTLCYDFISEEIDPSGGFTPEEEDDILDWHEANGGDFGYDGYGDDGHYDDDPSMYDGNYSEM